MLDGLLLFLDCQELLGKVLDSVTEKASLRDGGVKKASLVGVPHLSKVEPEMSSQKEEAQPSHRPLNCLIPQMPQSTSDPPPEPQMK